ncbi:putative Hybrid histidine kinase [Nitrospira sp. KM1]|uniref:hybrid sensor histidine kinase/response regulator n=1 Tax=Nitrospira sp. KM1 TaxID=1936990 RepID=UPI0013A76822|nr:hybrid sensor histidine kinase/response regulator [Nitrospira sp. KM1]BCA55379.1 putative Hybrid histidine kinase [Nitrospira sp. KM1]
MNQPLRLLHLEDNPLDADLIRATLIEAGLFCITQRVDTRAEFFSALKEGTLDLILADYSLPGFDGISALALARQHAPDVPFLFVSGQIGEELAIDAMHQGATDYVFKQRLGRLVPSVQRALRERDERTERRRAEEALRQSEKQFRQAQKMEAVGRLAGGIAHDFNNLLTVIMGYNHVFSAELGQDHPLHDKLEESQKAGERAATLIKQLLAFSRKQPLEPKVLALNAVVSNIEGMLRRVIGADIRMVIAPGPDESRVRADQAQLEQVIMNLVVNARDAMPDGGSLRIETSSIELMRSPVHHVQPLPPGPYVKLSVIDTGSGMDRQTQSHIFEPFFTTKDEGKGSGLGLSTVFGIVTQCGGGIDLASRIGHGTRFDIYLPRVDSEVETGMCHQRQAGAQRGTETILLAEDDGSVRTLIRDELRKLGYKVIEAKNGVEACLLASQQVGALHLLLSDMVMPGMGGRELAQHLSIIKPDLRILFMSGYTDDIGILAGHEEGAIEFLQKPFTPETLAHTVRHLLDTAARPAKALASTPSVLPH